jgi:3-dehydroquinate synthase
MAMVDSSVGGKTAVNHPKGKNMIGAFYQPDAVVADLQTLSSLPEREYISGLSEVVKYGIISDASFFSWIEQNVMDILNRKHDALTYIIQRSCEIKAQLVSEDECEADRRALLNLGHTFGHAIEAGFGYGTWLHGEAVASGIAMASELSRDLQMIDDSNLKRIVLLLQKLQLPTNLINTHAVKELGEKYNLLQRGLGTERFLDYMAADKKVKDGRLHLILVDQSLGRAVVTDQYQQEKLRNVIQRYCI